MVTEWRVRQENLCGKQPLTEGTGSILIMEDDKLPEMTIENFLLLSKHGSALSIIDGYVIDITEFLPVHPGGTNGVFYI